jgi:membrane glycosyltransferase
VWAILMFLGIPAWTVMLALLPVAAWQAQSIAVYPTAAAIGLYFTFFTMYLMPKIAGLLDAMLSSGGVQRYGGWLRFVASAAIELAFAFLLGAVATFRTTIFMLGLLFGKSVIWAGQSREAQRLSWRDAAAHLWPQTLFGLLVCAPLLMIAPTVLWWSLPLTAGYVLAIPFAVATADPWLGRVLRKWGICGIPEDFATPAEIEAVRSTLA